MENDGGGAPGFDVPAAGGGNAAAGGRCCEGAGPFGLSEDGCFEPDVAGAGPALAGCAAAAAEAWDALGRPKGPVFAFAIASKGSPTYTRCSRSP